MPLAKCPRSGKLFNKDTGPVHPDFMEEELADYEKVLNYLAEHPNANPDIVANATGVTMECIKRMVEQGRIEAMDFESIEKRAIERAEEEERTAKLRAKLQSEMANIKLPEKKEVEFGGTVRSALEQKRDGGKH